MSTKTLIKTLVPLAGLALLGFACASDPPSLGGLYGHGNSASDDDNEGGGYPDDEIGPVPDDTNDPPPEDDVTGGEDNTFDHMEDLGPDGAKDPFEVLEQRQEEGPPEIRTRLHSCQKLQVAALANTLTAFGVDLGATSDPPAPGQLLNGGLEALGAANYGARKGEALVWTNSGATRLQDIFVQAAPQIIANLPNAPHCQIDGVGPNVFDESEDSITCNADAVTCLIGRPATEAHLAICNQAVASGSTPDKGKAIAVAAMLAAAHTCE